MFATHNIIQHNRLVRLVMLVIIVGLTIFLYTSYYANQTMERLPSSQRFHMPSLISVSSVLDTDASSNDNTFQQNNEIGDRSNSNTIEGNKLNAPSGHSVKQLFMGNSLNDNLSNSLVNNEISNIVQQSNLVGEFNGKEDSLSLIYWNWNTKLFSWQISFII